MEDRGPEIVAVVIAFLVLTWVAVALRCYVRIRLKPPFRASDFLSVASLVFFSICSAFLVIAVHSGALGQLVINLPKRTLIIRRKYIFLYQLAYIPTTLLVKLSIAFLLLSIIATTLIRISYIIYCVISINIAYSIFLFFFALFQCRPVSEIWLQFVQTPHGSCYSANTITKPIYVHAAITCATDWIFAIIPIFIAMSLTLNFRTKCYVAVILAIGSIAVIATIARFPYLYSVDILETNSKILSATTDLTIWTHLEMGIALIASSAATFRPLLTIVR